MYQYGRVWIHPFQVRQPLGLELLMDDTGAIPQQNICPGLLLNIATQMLIRCPNHFLTLSRQMLDNFQRNAGGNDPVSARLYSSGGVGINDNRAIRVSIAKL